MGQAKVRWLCAALALCAGVPCGWGAAPPAKGRAEVTPKRVLNLQWKKVDEKVLRENARPEVVAVDLSAAVFNPTALAALREYPNLASLDLSLTEVDDTTIREL